MHNIYFLTFIFMGFESFERRQAQELEEQGFDEYGVDKDKTADHESNPEFGKASQENAEQQKEADKKQVEKMQENINSVKKTIAQAENPERQAEVQQAESSLDSDFWPPLIDDTTLEAQSHIGNTEGSTSLDQTDK